MEEVELNIVLIPDMYRYVPSQSREYRQFWPFLGNIRCVFGGYLFLELYFAHQKIVYLAYLAFAWLLIPKSGPLPQSSKPGTGLSALTARTYL